MGKKLEISKKDFLRDTFTALDNSGIPLSKAK
jgi:hypothetical protein